MQPNAQARLHDFFAAHPALAATQAPLTQAVEAIIASYRQGGKVLAAGCGGSMSDAEHITGELLKSFRCKRPLPPAFVQKYEALFGEAPPPLEASLPAVCLTGNAAILTAVMNDIGGDYAFAQNALGLCNPGDVLIAISTSGNSRLLLPAVKVARAKGAVTVLLTGGTGGKLKPLCDIAIVAPAAETYLVQEQHILLYHLICAAVEEAFFFAAA
ncbi:MAG: SIS domain-containing protein [Oscillospiraceae bacterium]|jgi:D-sedoheptulose 7-phosphate isomerase|nr:SIS domain-containing protein [Oscillospiraceae bacterium]